MRLRLDCKHTLAPVARESSVLSLHVTVLAPRAESYLRRQAGKAPYLLALIALPQAGLAKIFRAALTFVLMLVT